VARKSSHGEIFTILCQEDVVATVICAMSKQFWLMGGFAFINDTDLIVTDPSNKVQKVDTTLAWPS